MTVTDSGRDSLADRVMKLVQAEGVLPVTPRHLVALLETQGWTDQTAQAEGYADLFALADAVFPRVSVSVAHVDLAPDPQYRSGQVNRALWHFVRGVLFAMPMILGGWASLYYGLTPWSYDGFGIAEATGIVLAMIASFLATGGMTQATARRGLFLISLREYALARRTAIRMVLAGLLFSLLLGLIAASLLLVIPVLMWPTIRMAILYYPFLCVIWLCLGLLYMLRRELAFTLVVGAGIALVILLVRSPWLAALPFTTAVMVAQAAGLLFIAAASLLLALWFFRRLERRADAANHAAQPGAWPATIQRLLPFFLYGLLYFAYLYTDRLLAWSTPSIIHPQAIWFNGPYELGLTWATLVLLLPMGVVEMGIWLLVDQLFHEAVTVPAAAMAGYRRRMLRLWTWLQVAVAAVAIPSAIGVYLLLRWVSQIGLVPVAPLSSPVSHWVFIWAAVGYVLLAGGLLNVLLLFTVNLPWSAVRATAAAMFAALAVGFVASRFWFRCFEPAGCLSPEAFLRYPQAIFGLVAGAALLWWLAGFSARAALSRTDDLLYLNT